MSALPDDFSDITEDSESILDQLRAYMDHCETAEHGDDLEAEWEFDAWDGARIVSTVTALKPLYQDIMDRVLELESAGSIDTKLNEYEHKVCDLYLAVSEYQGTPQGKEKLNAYGEQLEEQAAAFVADSKFVDKRVMVIKQLTETRTITPIIGTVGVVDSQELKVLRNPWSTLQLVWVRFDLPVVTPDEVWLQRTDDYGSVNHEEDLLIQRFSDREVWFREDASILVGFKPEELVIL